MSKIPISSYNLRYLLWKEEKMDRHKWVTILMNKLDCPKSRAKQLLLKDIPTLEEQKKIAETFGRSDEDFATYLFFDDKIDVLPENLNYLFESIEQKKMAMEIGVTERTVSRWKGGDHDISDKHLRALRRYFGLPSGTDLRIEPVFLSWTPIDDRRRRKWLRRQIEEIDSEDLRVLFPAFEKLFKD